MLLTVDFSHADFLPEPPGRPGIRLALLRTSDLLGRLQQLGVLAASLQSFGCISHSWRGRLWWRARADNGSDVGGPRDALVEGPGLLRARQRPRDRERYSGGDFHGRGCEASLVGLRERKKKKGGIKQRV